VTQSVIYVGIAIMLALGLLFDQKGIAQERAAAARLWWRGVLVLLLAIVFLMGSRGGVLAIGCAVAMTAIIQRRRVILLGVVLAAAIGGLTQCVLPNSAGQHRLWERTLALLYDETGSAADRERTAIWRIAIAQMQRPETWLVGIGPGNFEHISPQAVGEAEAARNVSRLTHAHNLFLNKFIEEGILGLASFLTFLGIVGHRIATNARRARDSCTWQWYGAVGGLVIPIVSGLFNAPWHQEHAMFASMALAMFLACTAGETRWKS
jgi:O-antigen ligase